MMNPAENQKPADGIEKESTRRKLPTAFGRLKKGLVEGLVVVGMCGGLLANNTGCGYEVPSLDPVAIPDGGAGTTSHGGDGGMQSDGGSAGDAGMAGYDAGSGGMDAGTGGMDAGSGGMDGGVGGMDAGSGGMDAGTGGMDAGSGGADAGVVCGSVASGSFVGTISSTTPRVVGNYTFTYLGDSGGDAHFAIGCTEGTVEGDIACPLNVETDVSRPSDGISGMTIKITPYSAAATTSSVQFVVQ